MRVREVVIVGGGPAGAAVACGLATAGREVMLLERTIAAHHKVCGEFLGPDTLFHLARLGLHPAQLGAVPIERLVLSSGSRSGEVALPFGARSLSRYRLDAALLDRAAAAGAEVLRGVVVRTAERLPDGWNLRCNDGAAIRCRTLVLATGKWPLRGLADRRDGSAIGLKMHLRLSPESARAMEGRIALHLFAQGYAGLEPVEGDVANLCVLVPRAVLARIDSGWAGLCEFLQSASPSLGEFLVGGRALWENALAVVCPRFAHFWRPSSGVPGVYPVGDRFAHIPPFAGDGLAIALRSADLAVEHIRLSSSAAAYLDAARRETAPAIRFADMASRLAGWGAARCMLAEAAAHGPALLQMFARRTRLAAPYRVASGAGVPPLRDAEVTVAAASPDVSPHP